MLDRAINIGANISRMLVAMAMLFVVAGSQNAAAQRIDDTVGIGGQVGQESGFNFHVFNNDGPDFDLLAAWDIDDFLFVNGHAEFSEHLDSRERVHFYYGPGAFVGLQNNPGPIDDEVVAGLSARAGLGWLLGQFELFGHITPRLALTPSTEGDVGGGVGLRYYFR